MNRERLKQAFKNLSYEFIFYREEVLKAESLSLTGYFILAFIDKHGPKKPSELALRLGITKPSVTQIVESLLEKNLIERSYDQSDRRTVYIALSAQGRELYHRLYLAEGLWEENLDKMDDRSVELLSDFVERIAQKVHEIRMELTE